ncbi:MAG: MMPL family transporter [Pseudomonadota bacterium]|nr:MMPL family transporter [Pseudomonadota bacterium]
MIEHLVRRRWWYCVGTFLVMVLLSSQLLHMVFNGNVNVMFDEDDPHYQRLQQLNQQYIDSNYLVLLFKPARGSVFDNDNLHIIRELTEALWQLPHVVRVDSLTNFPRLQVEGDSLIVANLVPESSPSAPLSQGQLDAIQRYAQEDQQLHGRLVSPDGQAGALFASVVLPEDHLTSVLELSRHALALQRDFEQRYPGLELHLNGDIAIENAMLQVTMDDILRVNPLVFATIFILLGIFLRSVMAIAATGAVVIAATGIASSIHVLLGFEMNPITMMAPAIIMILAVADSIHVLTLFRILCGNGTAPLQAMTQSLRKNLSPVFWTSVTTAVGFLGMNFGDSPPFRTMGNMAAIGVVFAFVCTFTVLPAVALQFGNRFQDQPFSLTRWMEQLARWVIASGRATSVMVVALLGSLALLLCIPNMKLNDDISEYFDESLPIYDSIQFARQHTNGVQFIVYSMESGQPNGIYQPAFLNAVEAFTDWLRQQPDVSAVTSYLDVLKRIHRTMNQDQPEFYAIPDDAALIAQYQLLYEMSLPQGMDLTHDIAEDHSALKLSVNVRDSDNQTLMNLEQQIDDWLAQHQPALRSQGSSQLLMFAHMGSNIIRSMVDGSLFTLAFITLFMIVGLRSFKFGLLSIIPNLFPAIVVYGIWSLTVGHVNHAAAMTFSICLGLVVDDTIHFISKYLSARRQGRSPQQAIHDSFIQSGTAIVITSVILICGVLLLSLSNFTVNDTMSLMLAGIISTALLFDLLLLPSLLLFADRFAVEPDTRIEPDTSFKPESHVNT